PAPGAVSLKLERVHRLGRKDVALRGDRVRVRGVVAPYVPGQAVVVRVYQGRKKLAAKAAAIKPVPGGPNGGFVVSLRADRSGSMTVRASHRATPAQVTMVAKARHVLVVSAHAAPGARGPIVRLLQSRLAGLHYAVSSSGLFDASTARAVIAYRKVTGMSRVALASGTLLHGLLAGRGTFRPHYPEHAKHVEVDLSRQVLALVEHGRTYRIFGVSSGKASTPTVLGKFHVYSKSYGTNDHGMVDSSYFVGAYAVHGYASVPTFPASHGCVRVPIPNALFIFNWLRIGDRVDVYR
ncbi:MAG: L,D-transpeptidase family protein, partial [Actinomycetota bacterium]|nr:L,D-transpeptidase family protein [Actinomycetota bacterium]